MIDVRPGDRVLFRELDSFGVAKVDLVRERHVTCFVYQPAYRRFSALRRRIPLTSLVRKIQRHEHSERIVKRIEALRNERNGKRIEAQRWFEARVADLIGEDA